jgi:hypothetical protein
MEHTQDKKNHLSRGPTGIPDILYGYPEIHGYLPFTQFFNSWSVPFTGSKNYLSSITAAEIEVCRTETAMPPTSYPATFEVLPNAIMGNLVGTRHWVGSTTVLTVLTTTVLPIAHASHASKYH